MADFSSAMPGTIATAFMERRYELFSHGLNIGEVAMQYLCLLFSLCFHEAAHAAMANWRGDPSARLLGRMSLNPLAHIDPVGTVVMPLLMIMTSVPLIGWAKPVPFNPRNLRNLRTDPALIGFAGPASNFLLAIFFALVLRLIVMFGGYSSMEDLITSPLTQVVVYMVLINFSLAIFNLIPVPPLDGGHVIYPILPANGQRIMEQIGPFGIVIAFFLARPILSGVLPIMLKLMYYIAFFGSSVS